MKLRRTIFGLIVIAGFLILVLGLSGVFLSREDKEAAKKRIGPGAAPESGLVATGFQTSGENWDVEAPVAITDTDGSVKLKEPIIHVTRTTDKGDVKITARGDRGTYTRKPEDHVNLSGHVRIDFSGAYNGVLTTETLDANPVANTGRTDEKVDVVLVTEEGQNKLSGVGAEFAVKQRTLRIFKDIRIEATGGADIFGPAPAKKGKESAPAALPKLLTCKGPCFADGFKRTADLNGDVVISQGDNELRAQHVIVQMPEKGSEPERFFAEGHVTFKNATVEGASERVTRTQLDERMLLEGKPAFVKQGGSRIEADRIEVETGTNRISVPTQGRLEIIQEEEGGENAEIRWSKLLRFDPTTHEAVFRGDVVFKRSDQTIECQILMIRMDADNRQMTECRAEGNVRIQGKFTQSNAGSPGNSNDPKPISAKGRELVYMADKDVMRLLGDASVEQEGRTIRGEDIEFAREDSSIKVAGAGTMTGTPPAGTEEKRFDIAWDQDMQFARAEHNAAFRRDVKMVYGIQTLRADRVQVNVTDANRVEGFDATGAVSIQEEKGRQMTAQRIVAKFGADNQIEALDATGQVAIQEPPAAQSAARTLKADRVVSRVGAQGAVEGYEATGHVMLQEGGAIADGGRVMRAETMSARIGAGQKLAAFDARGRTVTIEEQNSLAVGDRLTWDAKADLGRLTGAPVELRQQDNRLFGDVIEFSQQRGAMRILSAHRVEASMPATQKLGHIGVH